VSYYPVFLDLRGRAGLVVGGGDVAHGKIDGLLRAAARVTVVAPRVAEAVQRLAARGRVTLVARPYDSQDVRGFQVVVAATDDPEVNRRVADDAQRAGVIVNVVDDAEQSTFIAPAVLERGDLQIAVSTAGASPSFAVYLRDRLAAQIGPEYGVALAILRKVRQRLRAEQRTMAERRRILRKLADAGLVDHVRSKDRSGIEELLHSAAGESWTLDALGVDLG
jgi:precorrin-2 dehydrogenase/sirohydrochlorin ferrochelatase